MIFPSEWTKSHKITIKGDKVGGSADLTDYTVMLNESNLSSSVFTSAQGQEINTNFLLNDANLLSYWRFENDLVDVKGNNSLTLSGSVAYNDAKFTKGCYFNQTGYGYKSFTNLGTTVSFSIGCWFKVDTIHRGFFMARHDGSTRNFELSIVSDGRIFASNATGTADTYSTTYYETNKWYHVVFVHNYGVGNYLYVNGRLDTANANSPANGQPSGNLCVGAAGYVQGNYVLDGIMDDAFIFNRALSPDEVRAIYAGGADIRFSSDANGTQIIPHETYLLDKVNSKAEIYVKIPTLSYVNDTDIYIWYGHSSAYSYGRPLKYVNRTKSDANLYFHYELDDNTSNATITDRTANARNGTYKNSSGNLNTSNGSTSSIFNTGITFDGTSRYIITPKLRTTPASETLSLWVKANASGVICSELDTAVPNASYHYIKLGINTDYSIIAHIWNIAGTLSLGKIQLGVWTHITITYDGSVLKGFVNGIFVGSKSGSRSAPTNQYMAFGATDGQTGGGFNSTGYFNGAMDDISYFDRVLTETEIAELYGYSKGAYTGSHYLVSHDMHSNSLKWSDMNTLVNGPQYINNSIENDAFDYSGADDYSHWGTRITDVRNVTHTKLIWVNMNSLQDWSDIWNMQSTAPVGTGGSEGISVMSAGNIYHWRYGYSTISTSNFMSASAGWQMVTVTYDASNRNVLIYGNNNQIGSGTQSGVASGTYQYLSNSARYIGTGNQVIGSSKSQLDEFIIVGGVMTQGWIETYYNNFSSPSTFAIPAVSQIKKVASVSQSSIKKIGSVPIASIKKFVGVANS